MSMPVDLELKKAFTELQIKMVETRKKIQVIDNQIGVLKRVLGLAEMTQAQIDALPLGTDVYESVGRMFILADVEDLQANITNRITLISTRTGELEDNKIYLESNLKDSEDNLREMVQQRKDQCEIKSS